MVGGTVIEVVPGDGRVWVNVRDDVCPKESCAVYVERNETAERVTPGDALWWQSDNAYWTPKVNRAGECQHREHITCERRAGVDYDIPIRRLSYSGVGRPEGHDVFDHEEISA